MLENSGYRRISPNFGLLGPNAEGIWCVASRNDEILFDADRLAEFVGILVEARRRIEAPTDSRRDFEWQALRPYGPRQVVATVKHTAEYVVFMFGGQSHISLTVEPWELPALLGGVIALAQEHGVPLTASAWATPR